MIPTSWLTPGKMFRIICHWTAGSYKVSSVDKEHYHIIIDNFGNLYRGDHEISDNIVTTDRDYAAHTLNTNRGSIGISVACMLDADDSPFDPGPYPMTVVQWRKMAEVAAQLCKHYKIALTPTTVLQHGEVQAKLGIRQRGKWDCMRLPWNPTATNAGDLFREEVKKALDVLDHPNPTVGQT